MKDKILQNIFSLSGASISIGVIGFTSAIVTLFVDVGDKISIKWVLLLVIVFSPIVLILLKIIYDLSDEIKTPSPFEKPIRYVKEEQVFVIRRNEHFVNNIVVGCYAQIDEIDRLAYLAVVHLVQDNVIQIKIRADLGVLEHIPTTQEELNHIIVRPVVPITAIEQFRNMENKDE